MDPTALDACVVRAQAGDRAAFGQALDACFDDLAAFIAVRVHERALLDELIQDTCVAAFLDLAHYRPEGTFASWLKGIARHRILRLGRDRARDGRRLPLLAAEDAAAPAVGDDAGALERLRRCLESVPEAARRLLQARHVEGVPLHDLARRERCSANALATRLCRLRSALRGCMERPGAQS